MEAFYLVTFAWLIFLVTFGYWDQKCNLQTLCIAIFFARATFYRPIARRNHYEISSIWGAKMPILQFSRNSLLFYIRFSKEVVDRMLSIFLCLPSARDCQWNASAIFRLKRTKTYDDICMPSWFCYSSVARPLFPDVPTVLPSRQFIFTFNRWSKNSCNIYGVGATQLMTSTTRYFLELF